MTDTATFSVCDAGAAGVAPHGAHGQRRPQYRLRVDDVRRFYDVTKSTVEIVAVISNADALAPLCLVLLDGGRDHVEQARTVLVRFGRADAVDEQ